MANGLNAKTKGDTSQTQQQLAEDVTVSDVAQSIVNKALPSIQHGIDGAVRAEEQTTYLCSSGCLEPRCVCACLLKIVVVGGERP